MAPKIVTWTSAETASRILGLSILEVSNLCAKGELRARQDSTENQSWLIDFDSIIDHKNANPCAAKTR